MDADNMSETYEIPIPEITFESSRQRCSLQVKYQDRNQLKDLAMGYGY